MAIQWPIVIAACISFIGCLVCLCLTHALYWRWQRSRLAVCKATHVQQVSPAAEPIASAVDDDSGELYRSRPISSKARAGARPLRTPPSPVAVDWPLENEEGGGPPPLLLQASDQRRRSSASEASPSALDACDSALTSPLNHPLRRHISSTSVTQPTANVSSGRLRHARQLAVNDILTSPPVGQVPSPSTALLSASSQSKTPRRRWYVRGRPCRGFDADGGQLSSSRADSPAVSSDAGTGGTLSGVHDALQANGDGDFAQAIADAAAAAEAAAAAGPAVSSPPGAEIDRDAHTIHIEESPPASPTDAPPLLDQDCSVFGGLSPSPIVGRAGGGPAAAPPRRRSAAALGRLTQQLHRGANTADSSADATVIAPLAESALWDGSCTPPAVRSARKRGQWHTTARRASWTVAEKGPVVSPFAGATRRVSEPPPAGPEMVPLLSPAGTGRGSPNPFAGGGPAAGAANGTGRGDGRRTSRAWGAINGDSATTSPTNSVRSRRESRSVVPCVAATAGKANDDDGDTAAAPRTPRGGGVSGASAPRVPVGGAQGPQVGRAPRRTSAGAVLRACKHYEL